MKKLTSGMAQTSSKGLSAKEISDIIKISGESGVSKLKLGAIVIEYHAKSAQSPEPLAKTHEVFTDFSDETPKLTTEDQKALELAEQFTSDPLAHEEAMIEDALRNN